MLKKIKNIALIVMLICSCVPSIMIFAEDYTERIELGGNEGGYNYNYTLPAKKLESSVPILMLCQSASYESNFSRRTCVVMAQSSSSYSGTYSADAQCLVYNFDEHFDSRMQNGIAAGKYARVRFKMDSTPYMSYFNILRHYY